MDIFAHYTALIIDPFTAILLLFIFYNERAHDSLAWGYGLSMILAIVGLCGQMVWSSFVVMLDFPDDPLSGMPWWVAKDLGYFIAACTYVSTKMLPDASGADDRT